MIFLKKINLYKIDYFIIFSWLIIWLSINSGPIDILNFVDKFQHDKKNINLTLIINFSRAALPMLLLVINLLIIFSIAIYNSRNKIFKNYIIIFFSIFILLQTLGMMSNPNELTRAYWILQILNGISIFIINSYYNRKNLKIFFYSSIIILWIVFLVYGTPALSEWWYSQTTMYNVKYLGIDKSFFEQPLPRTAGISRTILILYLFHWSFFLFNLKINTKIKLLNLLIIIFLASLIYLFQSRGSMGGLILINLFTLFCISKIKRQTKVHLFMLFTFAPYFLFLFVSELRPQILLLSEERRQELLDIAKAKEMERASKRIIRIPTNLKVGPIPELKGEKGGAIYEINERHYDFLNKYLSRDEKLKRFLSERNLYWKALYKKSKENIFFGFGSQADRYFTGMPAASAYIYALICGGLFFLLSLVIFIIFLIKKNLNFILKYKFYKTKEHHFPLMSLSIVMFFLFRSLFENTFLVFGIDFLLFLLSCMFLEQFISNKKIQ